MNALTFLIGHGNRADCVWTRDEFLTLCAHMLNGNSPSEFMLGYRDNDGHARFSKANTARAGRRTSWSWDTITDRAKRKVGIGFYPTNPEGKTAGEQWILMLMMAMHYAREVSRLQPFNYSTGSHSSTLS